MGIFRCKCNVGFRDHPSRAATHAGHVKRYQTRDDSRYSMRHSIPSSLSVNNRALRLLWGLVWTLLFRPSPRVMHMWRRLLLRMCGAKVGAGAVVHPSVRIWAPWKLNLGDFSAVGPYVDLYSVASITIGPRVTISQYSFLCTATHDYTDENLPLTASPIHVAKDSWVCADVFVGPGVEVAEGCVIGARSSVYRSTEPWGVYRGNPARRSGDRKLRRYCE